MFVFKKLFNPTNHHSILKLSCRILFRGSGGPRDYAARRISGAKLSFAVTVFDSTLNFHICRSYFAPIINTLIKNIIYPNKLRITINPTMLSKTSKNLFIIYSKFVYGGGGGYRTRVQSDSTQPHQVIMYLYYTTFYPKCKPHFV